MVFFFTLVFMGAMIFALTVGEKMTQEEYLKIGPFTGTIIYTLRLALGDFDFSILDSDMK